MALECILIDPQMIMFHIFPSFIRYSIVIFFTRLKCHEWTIGRNHSGIDWTIFKRQIPRKSLSKHVSLLKINLLSTGIIYIYIYRREYTVGDLSLQTITSHNYLLLCYVETTIKTNACSASEVHT